MFRRIHQYGIFDTGGRLYRPRAYGDPQPDGSWEGWLVFFPLDGGPAVAPPSRETTQSSFAALAGWAAGLTPVYLEGALDRAVGRSQQPPLIARLTAAEYEALEAAEGLEAAAEAERTAADLDEAASRAARGDAERIHRERLAAERALAATEEAAANVEARLHERAAKDARAMAAEAGRRRKSAQADTTRRRPVKRPGGTNK